MLRKRDFLKDKEIQRQVYETNPDDGKSIRLYKKVLDKSAQMKTFGAIIASEPILTVFRHAELEHGRVLEIGGGDGWASYMLKNVYPGLNVTSSDLTDYIHYRKGQYEAFFEHSVECMVLDVTAMIPAELLGRYDIIFCFSVLHHTDIGKVAENIFTLLKDGGCFVGMYEPFTSKAFYSLHQRHVRRADGVYEHCFTEKEVTAAFRKFASVEFHKFFGAETRPTLKSAFYYFFLEKVSRLVPFASSVLPCARNIVARK